MISTNNFSPNEHDIYICSYPRSGTTWVQVIVYQLVRRRPLDFAHISDVIPFLESALQNGVDITGIPIPRIFKTHLHFRHVAKWPGKKVYVIRDGRDVLVSYFHFCETFLGYREPFDSFFNAFLEGRVQYGSWFRHVASWKRHALDQNILLLEYEDLRRDLDSSLRKLAAFLGLHLSLEQRATIIDGSRFELMKANDAKFRPPQILPGPRKVEGDFIRQGTVGAWQHYFTPDQKDAFAAVQALYSQASSF